MFSKKNRIYERFIANTSLWDLENFQIKCFRKKARIWWKFRKHPSLGFSKNVKEYLRNKDFEKYSSLKNFREDKKLEWSRNFYQDWWFRKICFSKILIQEFRNYANVRFFVKKNIPSIETCCKRWLSSIRNKLLNQI